MPRVRANGLEIEYEETGSPDHPMILLVSGYMGQMTEWPDRFKQALADAGRRVVVFDNRDIGLTTAIDDPALEDCVPPPMEALMQGAAEGEPQRVRSSRHAANAATRGWLCCSRARVPPNA